MPDPKLTPLPPEGFRCTPWKNGGGVTLDIADVYRAGVEPGSWQGMIWRLGRTAIVASGPFSDLTGCERLQTVIVGAGLVLDTPEGEIDLRRPFQIVRYDGGTPIVSRLEDGPVEVVNLIADRSLCDIDLSALQVGHGHALRPGLHIVYTPGGAVAATIGREQITVGAGHALRIESGSGTNLTIDTGVAIVATIRLKS